MSPRSSSNVPLDSQSLYDEVVAVGLELPSSDLYSFTEEWEALRVCGKWFALLTVRDGEQIVVVKCDPEEAVALRQEYPTIEPGYHMNKKHWITLRPGPGIDSSLVKDVVTSAYLLIVAALPKAVRPVNPAAYAKALADNAARGC